MQFTKFVGYLSNKWIKLNNIYSLLVALQQVDYKKFIRVWVINVKRHKTATQSPTKLTLSQQYMDKLDSYVQYIRPAIDPLGDCKELLLLPSPRPIAKTYDILKKLEMYGVVVPTATHLRKEVATKAVENCSEKEITLLS